MTTQVSTVSATVPTSNTMTTVSRKGKRTTPTAPASSAQSKGKPSEMVIAVSKAITVVETLNTFCATKIEGQELTAKQITAVRSHTEEMVKLVQSIQQTVAQLGQEMHSLYGDIGPKAFNAWATDVAPKHLGMSRAKVYRCLSVYQKTVGAFGPATPFVMLLTDGGAGIAGVDSNGNAEIKPAALEALKKMPPIAHNAPADEQEKWARVFVEESRKVAKSAKPSRTPLQTFKDACDRWEGQAIGEDEGTTSLILKVRKFKAKDYATALAYLNETLESVTDAIESLGKVVESTPKTA